MLKDGILTVCPQHASERRPVAGESDHDERVDTPAAG